MTLTEQMKADGWIEHDGGPCPVPPKTYPALMFRCGAKEQGIDRSDWCDWTHDGSLTDIIAYRPEQPR
jgi:hypothetical protein